MSIKVTVVGKFAVICETREEALEVASAHYAMGDEVLWSEEEGA